jgi:pimeloyl-ACP methyl ester carboxylesterase
MQQKKFILWGRSMGAVAGLLYLATQNENVVIGGIFDSPFHSL